MNKQGFINIALAVLAILLLTGAGYWYATHYQKSGQQITNPIQIAPLATPSPTPTISVAGISIYTDSDFGFSFWYPSSWTIEQIAHSTDIYSGGTIVKTLKIKSTTSGMLGVTIDEFLSADKSITDNSNCGPAEGCPSSIRYYFDSATHIWMLQKMYNYPGYSQPDKLAPADVSANTMGGLHKLYGNARHGDNIIIPLSAKNFLVVWTGETGAWRKRDFLVDTIVATDPSVATPISAAEQIKTIQAEKDAYITN